MLYSSPRPCGIVQPHSTAEIPVLVEVQALGTHRTNVLIGVFGDERNPLVSAGEMCASVQLLLAGCKGHRDSAGENRHRLLWRRPGGMGGTNSSCLTGGNLSVWHRMSLV